jgi:hypothetical protein
MCLTGFEALKKTCDQTIRDKAAQRKCDLNRVDDSRALIPSPPRIRPRRNASPNKRCPLKHRPMFWFVIAEKVIATWQVAIISNTFFLDGWASTYLRGVQANYGF